MSAEETRIVDAHCHIASDELIPRSFVDGAISNILGKLIAQGIPATRERLANAYRRHLQDPQCDILVEEMDRAGIDKSILLAADFTYALKDCPLTIEETYERHRAVLARHPGRFIVFGGMDPRWGKDGLDLFERSLREFGFRGFKVYPPCGFSPSDAGLFPFYELCSHYRLPVVVHIGPTSPVLSFEPTHPFMLDSAARRFAGVNFIMAHGSVSFVEECTMMCAYRPNLYLDVSAFQVAVGTATVARRSVRELVSKGINHKILFGTDWPVFRLQGNQLTFVEELTAARGQLSDLCGPDRRLILHANAERLLAPSEVGRELASPN